MNLSGNKMLITELLSLNPDVLLVQEHWLQKKDLTKLNHMHKNYIGKGVSAIPDDRILIGRPYGGVACLWKRNSMSRVKFCKTASDRICAIVITTQDGDTLLIINCYLPCDNRSKTVVDPKYKECLNVIDHTIMDTEHDMCILVGDFNTDFSRDNAHSHALNSLIEKHSLLRTYDSNKHTFRTPDGFTSCIDHFFALPSQKITAKHFDIIDYKVNLKPHGHLPLYLELDGFVDTCVTNIIPEDNEKHIQWDKIETYEAYKECIENILISGVTDHMLDLDCFNCDDITCKNTEHKCQLSEALAILTDMCIESGKLTLPCKSNRAMPFWNDEVQQLKDNSMFWGSLWKENGKPSTGEIHNVYINTRKKYHAKINELKNTKEINRRAKMAESCANNNSRNVWGELKKIDGTRKAIPPHVDGFHSYKDICKLFCTKYKHLYNSVPSVNSDIESRINNLIESNKKYEYVNIKLDTVFKAIAKLKMNKHDGDKGLYSNMVINAPELWVMLLCEVINCMLLHGHNPTELLNATLSSITKDPSEDICDSSNFRGIALTSCIYKVIDWIIIINYESHILTSNLQFAYKSGHSTTMCSLTLKEVVQYYNSRNSNVYCALVDASKAFDRVRFDKMFELLIKRGLPIIVIRLLFDLYVRQQVRTSWCGVFSEYFKTSNGVRQGGVLSPLFFIVYIDELIILLQECGVGCYVGHQFFGALGSADDLTLLAPTPNALRKMLLICEQFGVDFDILYNGKKTKCMLFVGEGLDYCIPNIHFCGSRLEWSTEVKHLGNVITNNLSDETDMKSKRRDFIAASNSIISNFKSAQRRFCCQVFIAKCCHFYGCQMWDLSEKFIATFNITWKRCIRKLWYLPNVARSDLLPHLCKMLPFEIQLAKRFSTMYRKAMKGGNDAFKLLCEISVLSDRKGIIGKNVAFIENNYNCNIEHFKYISEDNNMKVRGLLIRELSGCISNDLVINNWTHKEIKSLIEYVACY